MRSVALTLTLTVTTMKNKKGEIAICTHHSRGRVGEREERVHRYRHVAVSSIKSNGGI